MMHIKAISKDAFLSFSDELKLKMYNMQFGCINHERQTLIYEWVEDNAKKPYYFEDTDEDGEYILFTDEIDAMAFKLKWLDK